MATDASRRLRIAVLGLSGDEAERIARLGGGRAEVLPVARLAELSAGAADLAVVFASPDEAAGLMHEIGPAPPLPLAVFVKGAGADDPGARLLDLILAGAGGDEGDRREQQERLQRSARLADIGQLAAGVAHEINTPLASIALRTESLLKAAADPRLQEVESFKNFPRYLKTIDEELARCKRIIGALLDFSRTRRPEVRETDLNQLAEKAADLVGHQMKLKQVTLTLALEPALPPVTGDDGQLRQCLLALLMNALDATEAGGRITVTSRRGPAGVELVVEDTGAGIPPEHLDKIFTPFFTTKPVGRGTGLGLPICHGIVAAHGGEILVDTEVGRGTRMTVALPAARAARPA